MGRQQFSDAFKESVALEVLEHSRPIVDVAKENNVSTQSVGRWVAKYREEHPEINERVSETEREELARLRRRVKVLEEEVEILGKATAFFVKKTRP